MRKTIAPQLSFVPPLVDHPHARELARVSEILDKLAVAAELVAKDLVMGTKATKAGRAGMSGERVLRGAMLKQMHCWSYEDLAFHLSDVTHQRSRDDRRDVDLQPHGHGGVDDETVSSRRSGCA